MTRESKLQIVLIKYMEALSTFGKHPVLEMQAEEALKPIDLDDGSMVCTCEVPEYRVGSPEPKRCDICKNLL